MENKMLKHVFCVMLLSASFLHAEYIYGNDYYVTQDGSGAHTGRVYVDAWSWTEFLNAANWSAIEDPYRIDPGDTVYLSGTIDIGDQINIIPGGGTAGNYIIIDGDDGVHAGATITPTYNPADVTTIYVGGKDYLEFRDIAFAGSSRRIFRFDRSNYIRIHNSIIYTNNTGVDLINSAYVDIYDNTIQYNGTSESISNDGIRVYGSNNINIYRNSLINWAHNAIDVYNNGSVNVSNIDMYNNYFSLDVPGYGRPLGASGQYNGTGTTSNIYFHHNFINKQRSSLQVKSLENAYVYNNIFNDALNCCEDRCDSGAGCSDPTNIDAGCSINYFRCTGGSSECLGPDNPWDCCTGVGTGSNCGGKLWFGTGGSMRILTEHGDASGVHVYNNVFGPSAEAALAIITMNGDLDNLYIANNIFYNNGNANSPSDDPHGSNDTWDDTVIYYKGGYTLTNVHIENNMIHDNSDITNDIRWDGVYYATFADFQAGSPTGVIAKSGNITGNPLFTNPNNNDYSLQPGSPAIDAGTSLSNIYQDGWDPTTPLPPDTVTTLNQNDYGTNWEIGAYTYTVNGDITPPTKPTGLIIEQ